MRFFPPLLIFAVALLCGCGEKSSPPAPAKAPEPPKPQAATIGKLELVDLPDRVEPVIEVICVAFVPNRVYEMVTRQQQGLDAYLHPETDETADASAVVSAEDNEKITAQIKQLQKQYPARVTTEFYGDNGEPKNFTSRESLYQRYIPLFSAVKVSDLVNSLNAISAQMREDHETLKKLAEKPGEEGIQARADIRWLAALNEYFMNYQSVIDVYDTARRNQVMLSAQAAQAQAQMASPEKTWERLQAELSPDIEIELYKTALETAYTEDDGSFQVPGHGKLIVRAMMDGYSLFFIEDGPGADHIQFTGRQEIIVDPVSAEAAQ